ncbi:addiction module antidote protein [Enterovirga rhinocerotis]|uniref:Putative addiction module antidote protein n=1 Tax=Enterovirga rhinocerotis TaxID=1339210 RepID=A0A4R7C8H7_9HYPH|nr:addiction module antidote protein [Enterovirga rhinocerotis]TDR94944.1 putative addiction module antidote protein [Enterovirga rhinocerotis]
MPLKTTPFEPEMYFTDPADQLDLLRDAFATGDAGTIADALGIVARVNGVASTAEAASVSRMVLDKGLTKGGDPKLSTLLGVLKAAGFELTVAPLR